MHDMPPSVSSSLALAFATSPAGGGGKAWSMLVLFPPPFTGEVLREAERRGGEAGVWDDGH